MIQYVCLTGTIREHCLERQEDKTRTMRFETFVSFLFDSGLSLYTLFRKTLYVCSTYTLISRSQHIPNILARKPCNHGKKRTAFVFYSLFPLHIGSGCRMFYAWLSAPNLQLQRSYTLSHHHKDMFPSSQICTGSTKIPSKNLIVMIKVQKHICNFGLRNLCNTHLFL